MADLNGCIVAMILWFLEGAFDLIVWIFENLWWILAAILIGASIYLVFGDITRLF